MDPAEAYEELLKDPASALVDVRTEAELAFVGTADLSATARPLLAVEWSGFPDKSVNAAFCEELTEAIGDEFEDAAPRRLFFICRSGGRSQNAARAATAAFRAAGRDIECVNVAEGFEGDLDENRQRGRKNGWKSRRLPWRQG